jgi:hypothetical protein
MPEVVGGLHPEPKAAAIPEQGANLDSDSRRYRLSLRRNVIELLARDLKPPSDLLFGKVDRRKYVAQKSARVRWAAVAISDGGKFTHYPFLVILLEIDPERIAILEFECDTPWAVDMDAITFRLSVKRMKIKSGDI